MGRLKRTSNKRKTSRKSSKKRSPSAYNYEENIQERLVGSKYNFRTFASRKMARPVVNNIFISEYDNNFNIDQDSFIPYRFV
jgi:hypothetical protein